MPPCGLQRCNAGCFCKFVHTLGNLFATKVFVDTTCSTNHPLKCVKLKSQNVFQVSNTRGLKLHWDRAPKRCRRKQQLVKKRKTSLASNFTSSDAFISNLDLLWQRYDKILIFLIFNFFQIFAHLCVTVSPTVQTGLHWLWKYRHVCSNGSSTKARSAKADCIVALLHWLESSRVTLSARVSSPPSGCSLQSGSPTHFQVSRGTWPGALHIYSATSSARSVHMYFHCKVHCTACVHHDEHWAVHNAHDQCIFHLHDTARWNVHCTSNYQKSILRISNSCCSLKKLKLLIGWELWMLASHRSRWPTALVICPVFDVLGHTAWSPWITEQSLFLLD